MDMLEALKVYLKERQTPSAREFELLKDLSMNLKLKAMDEGRRSTIDRFIRHLLEEESYIKNEPEQEKNQHMELLSGKFNLIELNQERFLISFYRANTIFTQNYIGRRRPFNAYHHHEFIFRWNFD
jgi:hypothetical protein